MAVTFRQRFGGWKLLSNAVKQNLEEMPDLAAAQAELEQHIAEAEALANRQAALKAELQTTVRQRREAETKGQDLRRRLAAKVQSHLGFKSERLHEFGIQPQRRRRPEPKNPEPSPAPAPAAASNPAKP